MNDADALRVLLLREIESAAASTPTLWTAADRDWATHAALDPSGADAGASRFLAVRARVAMQRLAPRLPGLEAALSSRAMPARGWIGALLAAGLVGLVVDSFGGVHTINLLAPPLWGVVLWNLLVYALLLARALRSAALGTGWLQQRVQALLAPAPAGPAALLSALAPAWARAGAPPTLARAAALLHALAAALALGLIGGVYLRGLVFDYRAGWQSTFLDAASVHALLTFLLAPAAQLTGITLPDAAGFEALRVGAAGGGSISDSVGDSVGAPTGASPGAASAAAWIHLLATSLALVVVLPRTLLALAGLARARRLAADVPLPLHEPYFQRLLREQRGTAARVHLLPHAQAPDAPASAALAALLGRVLGPHVELSRGAPIQFGDEDEPDADTLVPPGTTHVLLLADLAATPEAEHHGRLAERLAAEAAARGATALLCVDEAAFLHRFAAWPQRATDRRAAWVRLADDVGLALAVLDLAAAGTPGAAAAGAGALQRAFDAAARPRERAASTAAAP